LIRDDKVLIGWLDGHVSFEDKELLSASKDGTDFYYWQYQK